jgi:hypothetical protein
MSALVDVNAYGAGRREPLLPRRGTHRKGTNPRSKCYSRYTRTGFQIAGNMARDI